jgi:hypothetical protein
MKRKDMEPEVRAKMLVDCLRLGVVPRRDIDLITVNRAAELKEIDAALDETRSSGSVRVVTGVNGSGKSHHVSMAIRSALERNFMVLSCELQEVLPYRPKQVYHELVTHIYLPGSDTTHTLRHFVEAIFSKRDEKAIRTMMKSPILEPIVNVLSSGTSIDADLWSYLEGEEINIHELRNDYGEWLLWLPDFATISQVFCHMLNVLSKLAVDVGYSGVVIVIDEAEFVNLTTSSNYEKCVQLIEGLRFISLGEKCDIIEDDLDRGGYSTLREISYAPFSTTQTFLLISYTTRPSDSIWTVLGFSEAFLEDVFDDEEMLPLTEFTKKDINELVHKLEDVYGRAYDSVRKFPSKSVNEYVNEALEKHRSGLFTIRAIIQSVIEALDLARHYPDRDPGDLLIDTLERVWS